MNDSNNLHTLQYVRISVDLKSEGQLTCYASELAISRDGSLQISSIEPGSSDGKYYFIPSCGYTKLELDIQNKESGNAVIPCLKDHVVEAS